MYPGFSTVAVTLLEAGGEVQGSDCRWAGAGEYGKGGSNWPELSCGGGVTDKDSESKKLDRVASALGRDVAKSEILNSSAVGSRQVGWLEDVEERKAEKSGLGSTRLGGLQAFFLGFICVRDGKTLVDFMDKSSVSVGKGTFSFRFVVTSYEKHIHNVTIVGLPNLPSILHESFHLCRL